MKTKILCVLIAVGGVIACYQNNAEQASKPTWDVFRQVQPKTVVPIDRHSLSQQILTQPAFLSDFDLPHLPPSDSEFPASDDMVNVSYTGEAPVGSTVSQRQYEQEYQQPAGPSAYQQKLADQKAWRSFQRPVHLEQAGDLVHQVSVDAIAGRNHIVASSVDGHPIVPGIENPHQWYADEKSKPTESLVGTQPLPQLPKATPELELTSFEVVAVEKPNEGQQELDFNAIVAGPMPSVKSLLAEVASGSNTAQAPMQDNPAIASTPFEFEPTSVLAEPTPTKSQPTERFARRWETGRY